jgi:predicted TIM-barrel fold metal-dependent hydrolase
MVIDSHVHIAEPPNDETQLSRINIDGSRTQWSGTRADASLDNLLQTMEKNQVDQAIIMGLEGIISNRHLGQVINKNRNLHGFAWVTDPKQPQSVNELEKAVKEDGLIGLKLHPSLHDFAPSDPKIIPLIKKTVELQVPTMIHVYPWPPGFYYNNLPYHIDVLKKNVPEAVIIIGHMGHLNYNDMLALARQEGVYAETSWGLTLMAELNGLGYTLKFLRRAGIDNLVYGSDWFGPNGEMERQLELIKKLDLTREEREKMLGGNARNLLDL